MSDNSILIIFLVAAVSIFSIAYLAFVFNERAGRQRMLKRLHRLNQRWMHLQEQSAKGAPAAQLRRGSADSAIPLLDRMIKTFLPNPQNLRSKLFKTGRNITIAHFLLSMLLTGFVIFALLYVIAGFPVLLAFLLGLFAGLVVPNMVIAAMVRGREKKFVDRFPEAIDLIVRGLKSGLPVSESIGVVAQELGDPVGTEFQKVRDSIRIGKSMEAALWEAADRIPAAEFRFFVISLSVQKETGGNLAETLENLSEILRRRQQLRLKIRAFSSEAKASAYIIGALPFAIMVILYMMSPEYMGLLFGDPRGKIMLGVGLGWLGMGAFIMKKMVSFEI